MQKASGVPDLRIHHDNPVLLNQTAAVDKQLRAIRGGGALVQTSNPGTASRLLPPSNWRPVFACLDRAGCSCWTKAKCAVTGYFQVRHGLELQSLWIIPAAAVG